MPGRSFIWSAALLLGVGIATALYTAPASAWQPPPTAEGEPAEDHPKRPAFFRLPLEARTKLLVGLGMVILLGVVSVVSIRAIGRLFRLYSHGSRYESAHSPIHPDDWARKSLTNDEHHDPRESG